MSSKLRRFRLRIGAGRLRKSIEARYRKSSAVLAEGRESLPPLAYLRYLTLVSNPSRALSVEWITGSQHAFSAFQPRPKQHLAALVRYYLSHVVRSLHRQRRDHLLTDRIAMDKDAHKKRWAELEKLFDDLIELSATAREKRLHDLAEHDPELQIALLKMLAAAGKDNSFLDQGDMGLSGDALDQLLNELGNSGDKSSTLASSNTITQASEGSRIGAYRLVKHLGTGGMAEVWLAERDDGVLQQKVAIKLLHPLMGANAAQRFRSERHILSALRHDGIAKILDAGTAPDLPPYLVLEYVDGVAITDYCQQHDLGLNKRLEIFREVCDAVGYAHRRLIVHRDLKPSNIMVTQAGRVKLVDFGIAKLLDPKAIATGEAPLTKTGLFLMTPDYAAPEQVRGETITTATDVYGLGVLLFEILTGVRPFDLQGKSASEVERIVCETTPDKPSTGLANGEMKRKSYGDWSKRLRGDLDTIVLKSIRKEPDERYATVQDLADDVGRYLNGRPVTARPATFGYRARKFVQRNRVGVAATVLVASAVIAGVVATAWQANAARQESARAQAVSDFLFDLFEGADPETNPGEPLTVLNLLDEGADKVSTLQAGPHAQTDMLRILGTLYSKLGEVEKGEAFLRQATDVADTRLHAQSSAAQEANISLAIHLASVGDPVEAENILQRLLSDGAGEHLTTALTWTGVAQMKRGDYEQAEEHLRMAIDVPTQNAQALQREAARMELGNLLMHQERWEEAESTLRQVFASRKSALGHDHVDVAIVLWNLAELMLKTARFPEAETLHREILDIRKTIYPNGHPNIARSLGTLGAAIQRQGRFEEAGQFYQQAVDAWDPRFGRANPSLGEIYANLAALRYRLGDLEGAVDYQSNALNIWNEIWGEQDDNMVAAGLNNLGVMYRELGVYGEANIYISDALSMRRRLHGDSHATVGMSLANLGRLRLLEGRLEQAEQYSLEGLAICEKQLPEGHPALLASQMAAGAALTERDKPGDAISLLQVVADGYAGMLPPTDARLSETHLWMGIAKAKLGHPDAREHLTRAKENLEAVLGEDAALTQRATLELALLP